MLVKNKRFFPFLALILCTIILAVAPVYVRAAEEQTVTGTFAYSSHFSAMTFRVESTEGSASASGSSITIKAKGITNCGIFTTTEPSTTTLTLTPNKTVAITCKFGSKVNVVSASSYTDSGDSKVFIVSAGESLCFAVTASDGTEVTESVTFSKVEQVTDPRPADRALFTVGSTYYDYLDLAIAAAANNNGTITAVKNGTAYHSSYEDNPQGYKSQNIVFTIPSNVYLLVPYASGKSNFDEKPDATADTSYYNTQSSYVNLVIPGNTTIDCSGKMCVDSAVFVGTNYCGTPVGKHGRITLEEGSKLNLKSGSVLYCYGYITGVWDSANQKYTTGTVTAESNATVYESFQAIGWRGGSLMREYSGNSTIKSFAFSDYAAQNIESDFLIQSGAKLILSVTVKATLTIQETITFISNDSGFLQMGDESSILRTCNPDKNRIAYNAYGSITLGSISVSMSGVSLDTASKIFALNSSMDLTICAGSTVTIPYEYKIMPGATVTVEHGGKAILNGKIYIYDTADFIRGVSYVNYGTSYDYIKSMPVSYIAATGYMCNPFGSIYNKGIESMSEKTPCGKMVINGELTVNSTGGLYTTSDGGKNAGKVITGTGKIVNNSTVATGVLTDHFDEFTTWYNNSSDYGITRVTKTVTPAVGLIMGLSANNEDYRCFEAGKTYYGTENDYWYEYTISTVRDDNPPLPVGYIGNGLTIGYDANNIASSLTAANGSYVYTAPGTCYTVTSSAENTLTAATDGVTYTLTNVTTDITLGVNANHTYTNNTIICDKCRLFEFKAANIRLGNNLDMLFAFPWAGIADPTGHYVRALRVYPDDTSEEIIFTYGSHSAVITPIDAQGNRGESKTVYFGDNTWGGTDVDGVKCFFVRYSGFAAKDMCDLISVSVHRADGTAVSVVWTDSIRHYCDRMLRTANNNSNTELSTLLADMLNYGAACQKFFKYNTNNLANAGFGATGSTTTFELKGDLHKPNSDYFYGDNLVADSNSQFIVGFTNKATGLGFTYSFTNHWGKPVTRNISSDDLRAVYASDSSTIQFLYHPLMNLRIADARITFTITLSNGQSWTDSVESYCWRMIEKANASVAEGKTTQAEASKTIDVMTMFMRFSDSAYNYLHAKEVTNNENISGT